MKKISKIIIAIIVLLILAAISSVLLFYYRTFQPYRSGDTISQEFIIQPGEGVNQISARLVTQGLIPNNFYFDTYLWLTKNEGKLQPGTYALSPAMSAQEIATILIEGKTLADNQVMIPEGATREEVAAAFAQFHGSHYNGAQDKERVAQQFKKEFLQTSSQADPYRAAYPFLADAPSGATLEGYLFPDTYELYSNATPEEIIKKMLDNFGKKVGEDLLTEIKKQNKTLFEKINLAAIVEREVRHEEEMKKVTGVYQNRLNLGINLQSDATITYLTKKKDPQPTYEDTQIDSPYNTYRNNGLPPGPIGNPGLQAIKAAIYPAQHNYLFFITKLDTGEAIFAKTAEEHLANKKRYLD